MTEDAGGFDGFGCNGGIVVFPLFGGEGSFGRSCGIKQARNGLAECRGRCVCGVQGL